MHRDTLRRLLNALIPYALPLPALAGITLLTPQWPGYLAGVAALGYLLWTRRLDGLGQQRLARCLLVVVVFVGAARGDGLSVPLALAGLLLVGLVSAEPVLVKALETGRLRTENLAVRRAGLERMQAPRWPYLAHTALVALFHATAALALPAWPVLAGIGLAVGLGAATVFAAWRRRAVAHDHRRDAAVWQALVDAEPVFAIHFSAPTGTEYHVGMWLPYLERLGMPYLVILREARCMPEMARLTSAPIVLAPTFGHLKQVIPPSLKACFYVNNGMKNVQMIRFADFTHIQLLHGDSDKASSYNPATAMFDKIFVAGQAGIDRYLDNDVLIPDEKFEITGRPQVSEVRIDRKPIKDIDPPTVLYAPTWAGWFNAMNHCSLPIGATIVRGLLAHGATVICRPHPYTTNNQAAARQLALVEQVLAEDAARTGRRHLYGRTTSADMTLVECMNAADAMVSDVTAVASDWLYSEKPFAIIDMMDEGERFTETFPLSRVAYVIDSSASNLDQALGDLLHSDPFAGQRASMKTHYLGEFPDGAYADGFVEAARRCVLGEEASLPVAS